MSTPPPRIVFLDTETTGLDAEGGDRIVEIGCIEMVNRRLSGRQLHHYLNPERASSPEAQRVHGLEDDFLAGQPLFAAVADELLEFLADAELVIHNAAFDIGFLDVELGRIGRPRVAEHVARITDSLTMARETYPGKSNSLDALCKRLEVDASGRTLHGALLDAGLLAEVYIRMTRGQESLVIEAGAEQTAGTLPERVDFSCFVLPVVEPSEEERAAHEAMLADLDKASRGRTLWRAAMA
jgi:DNA polymerase III subunit epsilon